MSPRRRTLRHKLQATFNSMNPSIFCTTVELPNSPELFVPLLRRIRKAYSQAGISGLIPVKIGNRFHWPLQDVATLLAKGNR